MKLIRRKLLKAPLLGLVSRSFVMSGVSAQEKNSPKDESGNTFDVIVLGCGIAGVVAAYQARIDGASVALFEKMDRPAGNAICALWGGVLRMRFSPSDRPGSKRQRRRILQSHDGHFSLAR